MSGNKARRAPRERCASTNILVSRARNTEDRIRVSEKGNARIRSLFSVFRILQVSFVDLVVLAEEFHPIPFRTRPLKPPAPMVLRPKPRESRSLPGLQRTFAEATIRAFEREPRNHKSSESPAREISRGFCFKISAHSGT